MLNKLLWMAAGLIALSSCQPDRFYARYQSLPEGWKAGEALRFELRATDTTQAYDVFIQLRNNEQYPFSNIFLLVNMEFPDGQVVADTLEYEMAAPTGEWLGKGFSAIKESELWYRERVRFPDTGQYTIAIEHAMRSNGKEKGEEILKGITEVGISVEKSKSK